MDFGNAAEEKRQTGQNLKRYLYLLVVHREEVDSLKSQTCRLQQIDILLVDSVSQASYLTCDLFVNS